MANIIYPKYKQALLDRATGTDLNDDTVKVALIDTGVYTYSASHEFYSSLSGVVGTPETITNKTITNGLFDGNDLTFANLSGNTVEALVIYIDSGNAATSRLVAYIDTGTGLPINPSGTDVDLTWNASGILQL